MNRASGSTQCLFCGGQEGRPLTNEHVNPQWLIKHLDLPADDQMLQGVVSKKSGELAERPRIHSSHSFVQGRVCAACNNGWLSKLEANTGHLLVSLIDDVRTVESLSDEEKVLVARWAVKTAYLHSWTGPLKAPVQIEHLTNIYGDNGMPAVGVGIFAMQDEFVQPSAYIQTGHWPQLCTREMPNGVETPAAAYKIGLQYRNLYLVVAFWPEPTSVLTRAAGMHVRLFPLDAPDFEWAFLVPEEEGAIGRLKIFTEWLGVRHTT